MIGALLLAAWLGGFLATLPGGISLVDARNPLAAVFVTVGWPLCWAMWLFGMVEHHTDVDVE